MIIRDAFFGVKTFSAFTKRIGIAKNILSQRLDHLQQHDIIQKRPIGLGSSRFEYSLTEKGLALFPVIVALGQWGDEWVFGKGHEPIILIDRQDRQPIKPMRVEAANDRTLNLQDVTFEAGPGATKTTKQLAAEADRDADET